MIPTTAGEIPPEKLGFTLMHEHVVNLSPGVPSAFPFLYDHAAILERCVRDLRAAVEAGVDTIVDVTTADLGRDPELVAEAAARAGINIVLCTGIWTDVPRYFQSRAPDDAAEVFVREIQEGIAGTGILAGIIKVASDETVTPAQEIILRGAARACKATGVAITTHTDPAARTGLRQLEILREEGVDLSRVAIGHSITQDLDYLRQLYAAGCSVSWDQYGWLEWDRNRATQLLRQLVTEGYAPRTVLSHDHVAYWDSSEASADSNFTYISRVVLPALRELGTPEEAIRQMTVGAPARLLDRP